MTRWWDPNRFQQKREKLEARAAIMRAVRQYFDDEKFTEVDTPALQLAPSPEPHLQPFVTEYIGPRGEKDAMYLATSPELSCKKLLVAGMERIYQLAHMYRNGERTRRHSPEFMLLEWYRVQAGYKELMDDCMALLHATLRITGRTHCDYNDRVCDAYQSPEIISVDDAFKKYVGFSLLRTADNPHNPRPEVVRQAADKLHIHTADDDRWDDIALRILGEKIEPHLGESRVTFLTDYPLSMAALARPKAADSRVAERFEMYVCGVELANAFVELTDAAIQRARFEDDAQLRKNRYGKSYPYDDEFLTALEQGLPQAAGIALGFDRLVMLATGAAQINDVLWAPVGRGE